MNSSHNANVKRQFGPRAAAYVTSSVHSGGHDLDHIEECAKAAAPRHALDLGAGGGHVAYRLARHAAKVTACDLSEDMLAAIDATAQAQGLDNITGTAAAAEALPFDDAAFDFLACRFSAHHWRDLDCGLREARRVLAPGKTAVFVDAHAPESPAADVHLQAIELLRDPSHVRDYRVSEWLSALGRAGFTVTSLRTWRLRMDFASWIERMQTPQSHVAAIRSLQRLVSNDVARHFELENDGSFMLDTMLIEAA